MEAVPRLPMVYFQLKVSPEPTYFATKLKLYIRDFYNEDPESYNTEIHQLESLRASAIHPPIDVKGCELLKRYYCQLHFLQSRFPMGKDGPAAVTFTWKDTYANMVCSLANIRFEMISILYNIGAIHTQSGARTERTSADGMKMACTHFQCAAWAFEHLKNSYPQPPGVDLAPELMTFMYHLCLAQAQECILEKSMLDNRKPSIIAKVARQIVDYYDLALKTLEQGGSVDGTVCDTVGTKILKIWKRYVKFKRTYHLAVTQLYQGLAAEEQRKMGERVAFYNVSLATLNQVRTIYTSGKGILGLTGMADEKEAVEDALTFTNDVIEGKRKAAKNENEYIYHEEVPEKEILPSVKGASLVKGISFNVNDPEVSGPDIFARLVPMKVHEANSLYSEEKAKLLRSIGAKIEERDQTLNTYLMSLKLEHLSLWDPDVINSNFEGLPVPEELAERCAAINAKPNAIQEQVDTMGKLTETYQNVETMLKEINAILSEEQEREKQYQENMGKRPPSIVATDLTREAKKYEEAHAKASESNQALNRAMNLHLNNLRILSQPLASLIAAIPSPRNNTPGGTDNGKELDREAEKTRTRELKRILNKVDEMRKQRIDLHNKLRDAISQDDLTRLLVTATAESETLDHLFAEQIGKHQPLVNLIEQNLLAQDNILAALTEAYAQTAEIRKAVDDLLIRREYFISSLITSYDAYEDLLAKTTKGLEFYRKMEISVTKLLQRVKNTCKVQEEERSQILAQNSAGARITSEVHPENENFTNVQSKEQNLTGSGLKLKDFLSNRLNNIPVYSSPYLDHRIQLKLNSEKVEVKSIDQNDTIEPSSGISQQSYQYHPGNYSDYYQNQQSTYNTQYFYGETPGVISSSFPNTVPTFSDNVHDNAGQASTELSSTSTGYSYPQKGPIQYPVSSSTSRDQFSAYSYTTYPPSAHQGAHALNTSSQCQSTAKIDTVRSTAELNSVSYIPSAQGSTGPADNPYVVIQQCQSQVADSTLKPESHNSAINSYQFPSQPLLQQSVTPGVALSQSEQSLNQYPYQTDQMNAQQIINPQGVYSISHQYTPNQPMGVFTNTSTSDLTYSIASGNPSPSLSTNPHYDTQYMQSNYTDQNYLSAQTQQGYDNKTVDKTVSNPGYDTYAIYQQNTNNSMTYQNQQIATTNQNVINYNSNSEIIQSHAKVNSITTNYRQNYYNPANSQYTGYTAGYNNDYGSSNSYQGHPGYGYNSLIGGYQYSSGYQNTQVLHEQNSAPGSMQPVGSIQASLTGSVYQQQDAYSLYTNASNNADTNQTISSQYLNGNANSIIGNQAYYVSPYGQQVSSDDSKVENANTIYNQTYMQAINNETKTTSSETQEKSKEKSNIDLLSDLEITINHAPLLPEVPIDRDKLKREKAEETNKVETSGANEQAKRDTSRIDDKTDNLRIVWDTWYLDVQPKKDPLGDKSVLQKFIVDLEKYEKFVEGLSVKTLSGVTSIDIKYKEIREYEEREDKKQSCSVATSNAAANRSASSITYDSSRVELTCSGSPYINASHVKDVTQWTPAFIITQAPKSDAFAIFWTMVWEQESEVIACLATDLQLGGDIYWPSSEDEDLVVGDYKIKLKNQVNHSTHIRRVLSIFHQERKVERFIVHMQFLVWPSSGFPSSPGPLLAFATDALSEQALRRCSPKPIILHCLTGGALSGLFLIATAAVCHVRAGCGIIDVLQVFSSLLKFRRGLVDKESLLFSYRMVLYHAQDNLMKRGILSSTRSTFECFEQMKNKGKGLRKTQHCHPSDDFLHNFPAGTSSQGQFTSTARPNTPQSISSTSQEKPDTVTDPLSQLDPLWTIRR